jgi:hypothetical protein
VRAHQAYRLIVSRGSLAPSLLAPADRVDHIEIVEIDSGEVVLFWDVLPRDATRMARALRADLARLDAEEFIVTWSQLEGNDSDRVE